MRLVSSILSDAALIGKPPQLATKVWEDAVSSSVLDSVCALRRFTTRIYITITNFIWLLALIQITKQFDLTDEINETFFHAKILLV